MAIKLPFQQDFSDSTVVDSTIEASWVDSTIQANGRIWAVGSFERRSFIEWGALEEKSRIQLWLKGDGAVLALQADSRWWRTVLDLKRDEKRIIETLDTLEAAGATLSDTPERLVAPALAGDYIIAEHAVITPSSQWAFTPCRTVRQISTVIAEGGTVCLSGVVNGEDLMFEGGATAFVPAAAGLKRTPFRVVKGLEALRLGGNPLHEIHEPTSILGLMVF